MGYCSR